LKFNLISYDTIHNSHAGASLHQGGEKILNLMALKLVRGNKKITVAKVKNLKVEYFSTASNHWKKNAI
jgi:hypothetical protein